MKTKGIGLVAAGLSATLGFFGAPAAASAADLDDSPYRYQESYDDGDRRYGDFDRRRDDERDYGYQGSVKDGYAPLERAPRYGDERYEERYVESVPRHACAPHWKIRKRLVADGWTNFHRVAVRRSVVILRAERHNGRAFELKLDRCTGEVLAERAARYRGYGLYGFNSRRYGWPY